MTTKEVSKTTRDTTLEILVCRHHWIIESPDGPISHGMCRLCRATKSFKNIIESAPWREDGRLVSAKESPLAVFPMDEPESYHTDSG